MSMTKQETETTAQPRWDWVEASVWTERMLAALENGVTGGKWYRPNAFFARLGLFTLHEAHALARQPR